MKTNMPKNAVPYTDDHTVCFFLVPDGVRFNVFSVESWDQYNVPVAWTEAGSVFIRDESCVDMDLNHHVCSQHGVEQFCKFVRWLCRGVP